MTRKLSAIFGALSVAAAVASSAGAMHLQVQFSLFETTLLPTLNSTNPAIWQEIAANMARDPYAVATIQLTDPAFSSTAYREIRVMWGLACIPNGPPPVEKISYDFTAELRQSPGDAQLPSPVREKIITPSQGGIKSLDVTAGTVVSVFATAQCGGVGVGPASGGIHGSPRIERQGPTIVVPPFAPLPVLFVPTSGKRTLSATRYRFLRGRTLPRGKTVFVVPAAALRLNGTQSATFALLGAGVSVARTVTADDVANHRKLVFKIRPRQRGTIRYWVMLEPSQTRSNVVALSVR